MPNETFLDKLRRKDLLIGTALTLSSPEVAEILSESGFDWLFIDTEHTTLDVDDIQVILGVVREPCHCIVRAPANDEVWIKKLLDTGVEGIIIPLVNTAEEARKVVRLCKYPPLGARSVGMSRAQKYGMNFAEYVEHANERVAVIIQIEHRDAVDNIDSILAVPGIDAVFVGPYDLSGSMGKIGKVRDQDVLNSISRVRSACSSSGMPIGIFGFDAEAANEYIKQGFTLVTVGMDTVYLWKSAHAVLDAIHGS